jgi:hypothetical protein
VTGTVTKRCEISKIVIEHVPTATGVTVNFGDAAATVAMPAHESPSENVPL